MEDCDMALFNILENDLFDDWMNFPFDDRFLIGKTPAYGKNEKHLMKTDVKEKEGIYELDIDLPGFQKDEITAVLEKGYLTVSASKNVNHDEKGEEGKFIRKERYSGFCSRTFFVGEGIQQEDIQAKYDNGILRLSVPKEKAEQPAQKKYIAIDG